MNNSETLKPLLDSLPSRAAIQNELERRARHKITRYYPDTGPLRRELYPQHLDIFRAGKEHRERLFIAANRIGKSEGVGAFETALHLTGEYPGWWDGQRFSKPILGWTSNETAKDTRDINQKKLLGEFHQLGTGMIPARAIRGTRPKAGIPEAIEIVHVRHVSGGTSKLIFKSYDQGRKAFQGREVDWIWLDEEVPMDVYNESVIRTMTTNGRVLVTFTPLQGITEVVQAFFPHGNYDLTGVVLEEGV